MNTVFNRFAVRCGVVVALAAGSVNAQTVLYSTNFNAPTYTAGALIGQDGWLITGTSVVNPITVNAAGAVPLSTDQDANRPFTTPVLAPSGNSFFLFADVTISAARANGDYFMHIGDGGSFNFNARVYARSSGSGFQMALGTGSGAATYGTTVLNFNQTYRVVARYDIVAGLANDTGALFINPVNAYGIGDTAYVAATTVGTDASTPISSVNLRQAGSNAPTLVIDNLGVAFIPTPGAAALLGLGGLAMARRRRA